MRNDLQPIHDRAALLRSLNVKAAGHHRPTGLLERFMSILHSKSRTLCAYEPRNAEFIPPQRRHFQDHRNNLTTLAHITLRRHECRAPLVRFMSSHRLKIHTLCAHEPIPGKAALLRSLNVKAAGHHRPTGLLERFMSILHSKSRTLCAYEPRNAEFIPPQRRHFQDHRNNLNALAHITLKRHECRAPLVKFMSSHRLKIHTLCAHEPIPGKAALLHSLKVKATQHHRPIQRRAKMHATGVQSVSDE